MHLCVCVCVLGPEGAHSNGHPTGRKTENDETVKRGAGWLAYVLWPSQTDSSITGKIQRCTLAQTRAQAVATIAIPSFGQRGHTDRLFTELLTEEPLLRGLFSAAAGLSSLTIQLWFRFSLVSAGSFLFFFFISPSSLRNDGEEWQDTDNSSASLIRAPSFLITVATEAKSVNDCGDASEVAISKTDMRQQHSVTFGNFRHCLKCIFIKTLISARVLSCWAEFGSCGNPAQTPSNSPVFNITLNLTTNPLGLPSSSHHTRWSRTTGNVQKLALSTTAAAHVGFRMLHRVFPEMEIIQQIQIFCNSVKELLRRPEVEKQIKKDLYASDYTHQNLSAVLLELKHVFYSWVTGIWDKCASFCHNGLVSWRVSVLAYWLHCRVFYLVTVH